MKKIFLYIVTITCIVFIIPCVFTFKFCDKDNSIQSNDADNDSYAVQEKSYDYGKYQNIKIQARGGSEITEMNLDEYLLGVVSAEMPADYEIEALKAQAVVARTYTLYTITHNKDKHGEGVICTDSSCCQAWISQKDRMAKWDEDKKIENWKKIEEAVYSTKGQIIVYNGEVIDAFFHANSGGKTEVPANVWGGTNYPYLQTVETAGEEAYSQYSSEVVISKGDFQKCIRDKYEDFQINWSDKDAISVQERTDAGRVKSIKIGNHVLSGVEIRSIFRLKSANFVCTIDGENVKFCVIGYGHGVGLSQTGANSLAKSGARYKDIIQHFYKDVEIVDV